MAYRNRMADLPHGCHLISCDPLRLLAPTNAQPAPPPANRSTEGSAPRTGCSRTWRSTIKENRPGLVTESPINRSIRARDPVRHCAAHAAIVPRRNRKSPGKLCRSEGGMGCLTSLPRDESACGLIEVRGKMQCVQLHARQPVGSQGIGCDLDGLASAAGLAEVETPPIWCPSQRADDALAACDQSARTGFDIDESEPAVAINHGPARCFGGARPRSPHNCELCPARIECKSRRPVADGSRCAHKSGPIRTIDVELVPGTPGHELPGRHLLVELAQCCHHALVNRVPQEEELTGWGALYEDHQI